jgi:phosphate starvation-inducible PhoH-like protein
VAKRHHSQKLRLIKEEDNQKQQDTSAYSKKSRVHIVPRNMSQENYVLQLDNPDKRIVVAVGPAGTGKTLLAVLQAIKEFKEGNVKKILLTRPTVSVANEQIGFLPGTMEQKMDPWTKPIFDIFEEYYHPKQIEDMIKNKIIEICPLAFMRGRSLKNCIIISDETQNTTPEQLMMLLTRMGEGSRVFVTGDIRQTDLRSTNGLQDFMDRVACTSSKTIALCTFSNKDIERDPIVAEVLKLYGEV